VGWGVIDCNLKENRYFREITYIYRVNSEENKNRKLDFYIIDQNIIFNVGKKESMQEGLKKIN